MPTVYIFRIGGSSILAAGLVSVCRGLEYLLFTKHIGNNLWSFSFSAEGEYQSDDRSCILVHEQMAFYVGILSISVWRYRAHTLATLGFSLDHGSYLLAGIPCVPLIEKVLKRCKLIALVVERIIIIVDGDIPNLPSWE